MFRSYWFETGKAIKVEIQREREREEGRYRKGRTKVELDDHTSNTNRIRWILMDLQGFIFRSREKKSNKKFSLQKRKVDYGLELE